MWTALLGALLVLCGGSPAQAAPEGLRRWWLPENFSKHGTAIDLLFTVIFIVTVAVGVAVLFFMARYCIKYRYRADVAKAHFTHGNKKLEMVWTIIPTILLLALALWTKGTWDNYRESPTSNDPERARLMVIAEQFNWNVIYPGPDGKLGKYLIYPKTTDMKWPKMPPGDTDDLAVTTGVPGPAYLPAEEAKKRLDQYVQEKNPLGKDFDDPDGKDDNWEKYPGRPIEIPNGRPVEILLSSKDVIHSFFLPDFRVKLDAVPGMKGHIYFTATKSSGEVEKSAVTTYSIEAIEALQQNKLNPPELHVEVPAANAADYVYVSEQEVSKRDPRTRRMVKVKEKTDVELKTGDIITPDVIAGIKEKGKLKELRAYPAKRWDLVCEELCGNGHTNMRGSLIVLEPDAYAQKYEGKSIATTSAPPALPDTPAAAPSAPSTSPATQPSAPSAQPSSAPATQPAS